MDEIEKNENLQPVGLDYQTNNLLGRKLEVVTHSKAVIIICLFFISIFFVFLIMFLGPSYIVTTSVDFKHDDVDIRSYRYSLEISELHFFHDFITIDMIFKLADVSNINFKITTYFYSFMTMDARLEEKFEMPTKELTVYFNNSRTSDKIRIFEEGLVHFDRMSAFLTIRVPDHIRNIPTEFILSYADPAFSLFQVFIRFVLFVISFIIFISLLLSDFSVKESHISMKLMFYLDLIAIVASNPLYILEYFVESNFLKIVDTTLVQFLVVAVLFTAISIMEMRDNAYEDLKLSWVLKRFIPFGLGFLVFTASSVYSILFSGIEGNMDDSMVKSFSITKVVLLLVYIVAFVFVSIRFKSEFAEEKVLVTVLGCLMFTVITVSEIRTIFSESYGNHHILLLYSLIGAEVYTFFFNYINWPVDMSKLSLEKEDDQKNPEDIVNEGLAEQLVM